MHTSRLKKALQRLTEAIREVEGEVVALYAARDPLALHIFISRRHYRTAHYTETPELPGLHGRANMKIARIVLRTE